MGWEYDTRHRMRMTCIFIPHCSQFRRLVLQRRRAIKRKEKVRKVNTKKTCNTRHSLVITDPTATPVEYISKECPKTYHNFLKNAIIQLIILISYY